MTKRLWVLFGVAASLFLISHPVFAHHGSAAYDREQMVTIKGTVVDYLLVNPHVMITVRVTKEGSEPVDWVVEGVSLNMMVRAGFKKDTLKVGDTITANGHPGRNGKPGMLMVSIVLADGTTLGTPYN
jgi:hypothetical protein